MVTCRTDHCLVMVWLRQSIYVYPSGTRLRPHLGKRDVCWFSCCFASDTALLPSMFLLQWNLLRTPVDVLVVPPFPCLGFPCSCDNGFQRLTRHPGQQALLFQQGLERSLLRVFCPVRGASLFASPAVFVERCWSPLGSSLGSLGWGNSCNRLS